MIQQFFSKLNEHERKLFLIAAVLVFAALFCNLLLWPSFERLAMLDQKIAQEKVAIRKDLEFLTYSPQVQAETEALADYFTDEIKSEEQIIADYLKKVERLATGSEVEVSKITPAGQEYTDQYLKYFLTMDAIGSLEQIVEFVHRIDSHDNLLRVSKIDLRPRRGEEGQMQVTLQVTKMVVPSDASRTAKSLVKDIQIESAMTTE